MGNILHTNNATSTLASGITAVATSITVGAGHGALFPAVGGALYAMLTIEDSSGNLEIVKLTAKAGDVFTVVRAQEGTAGFAFSSGARVENRTTAAVLGEYFQKSGDAMTGIASLKTGSTLGSLALNFSDDTNTGIYSDAPNTLNLAVGGSLRLGIGLTEVATGVLFKTGSGNAAGPSHSFVSDPDTGMSAASADTLVLSTAGTARATISSVAATFAAGSQGCIQAAPSTAGLPAYSFSGDPNTGMSAETPNTLVLSAGGLARMSIGVTAITGILKILETDGSVGAPAYGFTSDPNSGMYSSGADEVSVTVGGSQRFVVRTAGIYSPVAIDIGHTSDTTITRVSAGLIAVEGKNVAMQSTTVTANTIESGIYTPSLTNVANVGTFVAYSCRYTRIGSNVTVAGRIDINATSASTLTRFRMDLPIASALASAQQLSGVGHDNGPVSVGSNGWQIFADFTNDQAEFRCESVSESVQDCRIQFTFSYQVI